MHVEEERGAGWWRVHDSAAAPDEDTSLVLHRDDCQDAAPVADLVTTEAARALLATPGTRPCPSCHPQHTLCHGMLTVVGAGWLS
ncbi:DUF6233 domain-containing protein [Streptomyces sp. 796.1]|uniref:DUF6233 domain-containing protein n=1 Tax=Streptomyces sp. 796.1 TaxID=3163029 RepID=UPI0039C9C372